MRPHTDRVHRLNVFIRSDWRRSQPRTARVDRLTVQEEEDSGAFPKITVSDHRLSNHHARRCDSDCLHTFDAGDLRLRHRKMWLCVSGTERCVSEALTNVAVCLRHWQMWLCVWGTDKYGCVWGTDNYGRVFEALTNNYGCVFAALNMWLCVWDTEIWLCLRH